MKFRFQIRKPQFTALCDYICCGSERQSQMIQSIVENRNVKITVQPNTKTTVKTSIGVRDMADFGANLIPHGAEHLKYHHSEHYNYFWSKTQVRDYFKRTKTQGADEYIFFLQKMLEQFLPSNIAEDFELNVEVIDYTDMFEHDELRVVA